MKVLKYIILTVVLLSFSSINLAAQGQEHPSSFDATHLTKATDEELGTKQIMLDGESVPVYNMEGERVRGMEMAKLLMSGNYSPDFYLDKEKEIKAVVLRESTEEEKEEMVDMSQSSMSGESELIGTDALPFTVTDINGEEYSLDKLKGKIIVLNFWFVECKPCIMEMPELNQIVEKYQDNEDVVFLGLSTSKKDKINEFLKENSFTYKVIPDSKKVALDYKVYSYPTHTIIGKDSKIVYSTRGLSPFTISSIEGALELLTKE